MRLHAARVKHGVIQDKLFLPGFAKLLFVKNAGFFGRILSIRIDAGSWVFDGKTQECQRPSWNYKRGEGGGIALDMMAHWRYMIDRLAAPVTGVCALMSTAITERVDERGQYLHGRCGGYVARAPAPRRRSRWCHYQ